MEQHQSHEPEQSQIPSNTSDLTALHPQIDPYLDRVCMPLARTLSAEEVAEQRAEMRTHLEALVAAHLELGYSDSEAARLALEQFGKEQNVAKAWKQECDAAKVEAGRGSFCSTICRMAVYSVAYQGVGWILWTIQANAYGGHPQYLRDLPLFIRLVGCFGEFMFLGLYTLFPAFLGFVAGRRLRGIDLMAAVLTLPCIQLIGNYLTGFISRYGDRYDTPQEFVPTTQQTILLVTVYFGVHILLGALGAGIARLGRRRAMRLAGSR